MSEITEDEHLQIVAQLGVEAEVFKSSTLGKYLADCAQSEIEEAAAELAVIVPSDMPGICELQNKIYRVKSFLTWVDEAIESGTHAVQELQQRQED